MKKLIIVLVVMFLLISCSKSNVGAQSDNTKTIYDKSGFWLERVIDIEAGVVCYMFSGNFKGGISCLPVKDTLLPQ